MTRLIVGCINAMMSAMANVMRVVAKTGVSIVYRVAIKLANPINVEIVVVAGSGGQKG
jgi:hypothetical protein